MVTYTCNAINSTLKTYFYDQSLFANPIDFHFFLNLKNYKQETLKKNQRKYSSDFQLSLNIYIKI